MKVNLEARALAAERKRSRTRAALIQAAMAVIADKGAEAASVADFVAAAGVSRGAFYNYFPTLEALLVEVKTQVAATLDREIDAALAQVEDPAERLAGAMLRFIEVGVSDPVWGWVFLRLDSTPLPPAGKARERFRREFEAGVRSRQFRPGDMHAGYNLVAGSVRMAVRAILSGSPQDCGAETVRLVLIGLGLDPREADAICRRRSPSPA